MFQFKVEIKKEHVFYNLIDTNIELFKIISIISIIFVAKIIKQHIHKKKIFNEY